MASGFLADLPPSSSENRLCSLKNKSSSVKKVLKLTLRFVNSLELVVFKLDLIMGTELDFLWKRLISGFIISEDGLLIISTSSFSLFESMVLLRLCVFLLNQPGRID